MPPTILVRLCTKPQVQLVEAGLVVGDVAVVVIDGGVVVTDGAVAVDTITLHYNYVGRALRGQSQSISLLTCRRVGCDID